MPNPLLAAAIGLNIAGAFMPGSLPPEPPSGHPMHRAWEKIPGLQVITPHLVEHRKRNATATRVSGGPGALNSAVWSGSVIEGSAGQYGDGVVAFAVLVPTAGPAIGSCGDKQNHTSYVDVWGGIDGWGNDTVEQAGLSFFVSCYSSMVVNPFVEAYPAGGVEPNNFPISAGDMVDTWVWPDQSSSSLCAAWEEETKQLYTSICIAAPGSFTASSLEWIVERPALGNGLTTLANFTAMSMWSAWSWSSAAGYQYSSDGKLVTMLDDSLANVISQPFSYAPGALLVYDVAEAYCASGSTCLPRF